MEKSNNKTTDEKKEKAQLLPSSLMRSMHPDLFSDSEHLARPQLAREALEYHLETITSRNQESDFAYFCWRLAEKEICPNLRPQTGPTGGGDSKADSETIPVSSEISMLWIGADPKAASERWAFAFSAMKNWKKKARSDIEGIAGTKRGYAKIYYVTNQFTRDKDRAALEDTLKTEFGSDIHILDRSWIINAVFNNDRIELAVEALHINGSTLASRKRVGPRDFEREQELAELDRDIADPDRYQGAKYQLAEDCLRAALLARGLEKSRTVVEGYLFRASQVSEKVGNQQQRLRVAYNHAWTALWWYDDDHLLNATYNAIEAMARGSIQSSDIEMLQNVWQLLVGSVRRGALTVDGARLKERTETLKNELDRLADENHRPNNALQARTGRLLISLNEAIEAHDTRRIDGVWKSFERVVEDSKALGDYPFEKFAELLRRLGEIGVEGTGFDALFEKVIAVVALRRSEGASGELLLKRAFQKLEKEPYDAIRFFGRAQECFIKREYRFELISALMGSAIAYKRAGLLWAARNSALAATERCLAHYWEDGLLITPTLRCLRELIWLELQLGRVPHVLEALGLVSAIAPQLKLTGISLEDLQKETLIQEGLLGMHFLNASIEQLREMELLPDELERRGLFVSKGVLLYALGYKDELRDEGLTEENFTVEEIDKFMRMLSEQPASKQITARPDLLTGQTISLLGNLLGCELRIDASNNRTSIFLAESLLGAAEAFLSTSLAERIVPHRSDARLLVVPDETISDIAEIVERSIDGETILELRHSPKIASQNEPNRGAYGDSLLNAVLRLVLHIAIIDDPETYFERVAGDERGFGRALTFAEISITTENVFGSGDFSLARLVRDQKHKRYVSRREQEWTDTVAKNKVTENLPPRIGEGIPPASLVGEMRNISHRDRKIYSVIELPVWDKAKWNATLYAQDPRKNPPLVLGLGFSQIDSAKQIFIAWRKKFGSHDKEDVLRISIITGVDKSNPAAYNVVVGSNLKISEEIKSVISVSRINHMSPSTSVNLERFLNSYRAVGAYLLAPAHFKGIEDSPVVYGENGILKTSLIVRPAWQIGSNDPDVVGIRREDDPIIPSANTNDAPILQVLERRRRRPGT